MKKFIFLFVAMVCGALSMYAGDNGEVYTPFGKGVQLISKRTSSFVRGEETVYGLRKNGIVLEKPVTPTVILQEELDIIVFQYRNGVNIYNLENGHKVGAFFIDKSYYGYMREPTVTIKSEKINGKKCYTVYYSNHTDRMGKVEQDVATFYRENGTLYKYEKKTILSATPQ
ncbi:MAG: hypothetical protein NC218_05180 [Acetobacter sp.]|nr:hypothetical protein [Acetobacter sp.]